MAKHTPGPWFFDSGRNRHGEPVIGIGPEADIDDCIIAELPAPIRNQTYADARLIAAAPELLAALRLVHDKKMANFTMPEWKQIESAIAKATGE